MSPQATATPSPPRRVAASTPTHAYETLTPNQAERLLQGNEVNRSLRADAVEKYARSMVAGTWQPHSVIWIDRDGRLIDGQHRLTAQVKAQVRVKYLVLRGVDPGMQEVLDTGMARTIGDVLHFRGEKNSQLLGAITRLVNLVTTNRIQVGRLRISNEEILGTLEVHSDVRISTDVASWAKTKSMTPLPPSVMGAAHWMIMQKNGADEATEFINRMVTLQGEREGSPVLALARRVNEIKRQRMRVEGRDLLAMVIKAWNYDALGRQAIKMALFSKSGEYVLPRVEKRKVAFQPSDGTETDDE